MSDEAGIVRVPAATIEAFDTEALRTVGMRPDDAAQVAQSLVHADLTGVFTHGSNFLPLYANWIQVGSIDPTGTPEVVSDSGATATHQRAQRHGTSGGRAGHGLGNREKPNNSASARWACARVTTSALRLTSPCAPSTTTPSAFVQPTAFRSWRPTAESRPA